MSFSSSSCSKQPQRKSLLPRKSVSCKNLVSPNKTAVNSQPSGIPRRSQSRGTIDEPPIKPKERNPPKDVNTISSADVGEDKNKKPWWRSKEAHLQGLVALRNRVEQLLNRVRGLERRRRSNVHKSASLPDFVERARKLTIELQKALFKNHRLRWRISKCLAQEVQKIQSPKAAHVSSRIPVAASSATQLRQSK